MLMHKRKLVAHNYVTVEIVGNYINEGWKCEMNPIGHFRVVFNPIMKARSSAKFFFMKISFHSYGNKTNFNTRRIPKVPPPPPLPEVTAHPIEAAPLVCEIRQ